MGSGSQVRLGCLVQRLRVYTVATVNSICPLHWTTNLCRVGDIMLKIIAMLCSNFLA